MKVEKRAHKYSYSGELMEAVRALDYKTQHKVCEAFNKLSRGYDWSDRLMFQRFEKSFTMIDAENLEEHFNTVMAKMLPWQKNLGH